MKKTFKTDGLTALSLFKVIFFSLLMTFGIILFLFAILSAFGVTMIYYNDEPLTGWQGFVAGIIMIPIFTIIFSLVFWLFIAIGQWLWTRFHTITITLKLDVVHHHEWFMREFHHPNQKRKDD